MNIVLDECIIWPMGKISNKKIEEWGLFGPFGPEDDLAELWHFAEEQRFQIGIEQAKKDIKQGFQTKKALKEIESEYKNLLHFVDNHTRLVERYKFDKKQLNQIEDDWRDYNLELYGRYCREESYLYGGYPDRAELQRIYRFEQIKLEEIEKRFEDLLSK